MPHSPPGSWSQALRPYLDPTRRARQASSCRRTGGRVAGTKAQQKLGPARAQSRASPFHAAVGTETSEGLPPSLPEPHPGVTALGAHTKELCTQLPLRPGPVVPITHIHLPAPPRHSRVAPNRWQRIQHPYLFFFPIYCVFGSHTWQCLGANSSSGSSWGAPKHTVGAPVCQACTADL